MSTDFKGKLAIITGASKLNGIGYATAQIFAKGGADVRHPISNNMCIHDMLTFF